MQINKQLTSYLGIGTFNTCLCLSLYYILIHKLDFNYIIASIIMYIFGVFVGYYLNSMVTFKAKIRFHRLIKYSFVYVISLLLNIGFLFVFVDFIHLNKMLGQIITTAILTIINYILLKSIVFRIK